MPEEKNTQLDKIVRYHYNAYKNLIKMCTPEEYFQGKDDNSSVIEQLIKERNEARASKNSARGHEIRKQLTEMGIVLEDSAQGTTWKKA